MKCTRAEGARRRGVADNILSQEEEEDWVWRVIFAGKQVNSRSQVQSSPFTEDIPEISPCSPDSGGAVGAVALPPPASFIGERTKKLESRRHCWVQ